MNESQSDKMASACGTPDVAFLISEFRRCAPSGGTTVLQTVDDTRFCRWPGQAPDGKKHDRPGTPAFPFDNASDTRPMLADRIVNERSALLTTAFWRAIIKPKAADDEAGSYAVAVADHFVNTVLYEELTREVELSAQYREHYGWCVLHPTWEQKVALKRQKVKLEDLLNLAAKLAQQTGDPSLLELQRVIMDPTLEDAALVMLKMIYEAYQAMQMGDQVEVEVPELSDTTVRRALKSLRATGTAEVPVPYICQNRPLVRALRPWDEVFVPGDTTSAEDARVIYRREWLTEAELRSRVRDEGYSPEWVEEAVKQVGKNALSFWSLKEGEGGNALTGPATATAATNTIELTTAGHKFIEVLHAFRRALDDDDVPGIWVTTVHPALPTNKNSKPFYAKHQLLAYPHGEYPFVATAREHWCRCFTSSRGVPEIVATWQNEKKALRDAMIDRTSMTVMPPINEYHTPLGTEYKFGPAVRNSVIQGKEPAFMQMPSGQGMSECLTAQDRLDSDVDNYFGLLSEKVPAPRVQMMQAASTTGFLLTWSRALQQMVSLAQQWMPDAEFAEVTGAPPGWLDQRRDRPGLLAAELHFDVRELDPELVKQRLEAMGQIVASDATGIINRTKLTEIQVRAVNPVWAKELIQNQDTASQQMYQGVENDLAQMFLGVERPYVENDPTAPQKLKFAQQIVGSNPTYQQALQQKGRFAELVEKWAKNLSFSVEQQQNKQIGRIGVKPTGA
jgi:hypothetical protein